MCTDITGLYKIENTMDTNHTFEPILPPASAYREASYLSLFHITLHTWTDMIAYLPTYRNQSSWLGPGGKILAENNPTWARFIFSTLAVAFFLTLLRLVLNRIVLKNLLKHELLAVKDCTRFMESFYFLVFYSVSVTLAFYIECQHEYLSNPERLWIGFDYSNVIPTPAYLLYLLEISHYIHSLYAVIFMNQWNYRDSIVLFAHHIIAVLLLSISYFTKTYRLGVLVLFLLDCCDIVMEGMKCVVKLKLQHPIGLKCIEVVRVFGFGMLIVLWALFRLYYFPIKAIYSASLYLQYNSMEVLFPLAYVIMACLWLIFILNIYWGLLILKILINALRSGIEEIDDIRDTELVQDMMLHKQEKLSHKID